MSLEKPSDSHPVAPTGAYGPDPLYRLLTPSEDSDWECAFMGAIATPSTTLDHCMNEFKADNHNNEKDHEKSPMETEMSEMAEIFSTGTQASENAPIEMGCEETIAELHVPISNSRTFPEETLTLSGSTANASELISLWTPQFLPETGQQLFLQKDKASHVCMPLHLVEGREDPEKDEGIGSPVDDSPFFSNYVSGTAGEGNESVNEPKTAFFEKCNILQWAIDDQQISDIPGMMEDNLRPYHLNIKGEKPETVTSASLSGVESDQEFVHELKKELSDIIKFGKTETDSPQPSTSHYGTPDGTPLSIDSSPETPLKRKRGRPARESPLDITPKLPRLTSSVRASDTEVTYYSDSCGALTDNEVSALKYRRMRDLNNEASKRCRETRKNKQSNREKELEEIQVKNAKLRKVVKIMEHEILLLKKKILTDISNPSMKISLARRRMMNPESGGAGINESPLLNETGEQPDLNAFWSLP